MSTAISQSTHSNSHDQVDKTEAQIEHHEGNTHHHEELAEHGFAAETDELPKGYFSSFYFIGSFIGTGMNLMGSTAGFAIIAPVLSQIDAAIGPGPIIWLSLVYTLGLAIGLTLVGRLTDIFGRRWFFISGVMLGVIGSIIGATAKTIPVLIGGQTLIGLSASTGYSYAFVVGELVPVKHRFLANAVLFMFSMPTAGFGAAISTAFILYTEAGWRWCYYLLIILNSITAILYFFFYFPPNFNAKHRTESKLQLIKEFDYVGTLLYIAGLLFFILGLSWGGNVYPWKDAHVVATIIVGFLCLVGLFVYEAYRPLKEPLIPIHLFKNRQWVASAISLSIGASVYYSQAIVWPQMTSTVYANGRLMWAGWVGSLAGIAITTGEIIGGAIAKKTGKTKFQVIAAMTLGTIFLGAMASCTPDTPKTAMALVFLAVTAIGYNEAIVLPICTILIRDQKEIGTAAGIAGSTRSAISTVASTIYTVVLTSRITTTIPAKVPAAVIGAGLPASSVAGYMGAIAKGGSEQLLSAVQGLTPAVLAAGARAYQVAYADAYRTVFLTSIAFGVLGIVCSFFVPNVDEYMTDSVATTLGNRKGDRADFEEKGGKA
ncbi:fungal trichothecene efflux pump [Halenospora varia]|nr:fungal trichothecene efflux pump [Halenospora varia]